MIKVFKKIVRLGRTELELPAGALPIAVHHATQLVSSVSAVTMHFVGDTNAPSVKRTFFTLKTDGGAPDPIENVRHCGSTTLRTQLGSEAVHVFEVVERGLVQRVRSALESAVSKVRGRAGGEAAGKEERP